MLPEPRAVVVDGSVVGLYEYGDPTGVPVFVFHGIPSCGAGFAWADGPAKARGLRLLAPDRPGVGLSTPMDDWMVADYPAMVTRLADTLGLDTFAVWGYSGGGPYAVAVAAELVERVTALVVAAGMGEIGVWADLNDFEATDRQMVGLATSRPRVARTILGTTAWIARRSPRSAMWSFARQLPAPDREVLSSLGPADEAMALFTQAFLNGSRGVVDDYRATSGPWGVDLGAITAPVGIFQGTADTMVPPRHAEELARRIPAAELATWDGEGHLATISHVEDILDWIVAALP